MSGEVEKCPILHVRPKFGVYPSVLRLTRSYASPCRTFKNLI